MPLANSQDSIQVGRESDLELSSGRGLQAKEFLKCDCQITYILGISMF